MSREGYCSICGVRFKGQHECSSSALSAIDKAEARSNCRFSTRGRKHTTRGRRELISDYYEVKRQQLDLTEFDKVDMDDPTWVDLYRFNPY